MDIAILVALGVLIVLVVVLIAVVLGGRQSDASGQIEASLQGINEARGVISDHAIKAMQSINQLGENLYKLVQQQDDVQKLGESLKDLLQAPKLRGQYGEAVLEEMLARVLPNGFWKRQYAIDGGEVDCVVIYRNVVVPIDAKFPRADYLRYMEAPAAEKPGCWKEFERAVRTQITSIQSKYVKPEKGTSEFALMFIPSEAIYYETIAEKNHLGEPSSIFEFAQEHRVLPVSPNTFYAFLQVVLLGLRNVDVVTRAKKIQEELAGLRRSFDLFYGRYQDTGKAIERAAEAYRVGNGHVERYKQRLDQAVRLEAPLEDTGTLPPRAEGQE